MTVWVYSYGDGGRVWNPGYRHLRRLEWVRADVFEAWAYFSWVT